MPCLAAAYLCLYVFSLCCLLILSIICLLLLCSLQTSLSCPSASEERLKKADTCIWLAPMEKERGRTSSEMHEEREEVNYLMEKVSIPTMSLQ